MRKIMITLLTVIVLSVSYSLGSAAIMRERSAAAAVSPLRGVARTYLRVYGSSLYMHLSQSASGFTPAQLRRAYHVDGVANGGQGRTIALIDAYGNPNAQSDLNTFNTAYGLPAAAITIVYPEGKPAASDSSWALETDVDLQMAHAMAPQARLVLEVARSASNADLYTAVRDAYTNHGATVVSMSFGGGEFSGETGSDSVFSAGRNAGVSFIASSGDSGMGTQYPAVSPYVTAVGGTSLSLQSDGSYGNETAWSGSGGGMSAYEPRPNYQIGFNNNAKRGIPDVAMVADPATGVSVYDSVGYQGHSGFFSTGGTSVAAPLFAGITALLRAAGKQADTNNLLYAAARAHYTADFHDITSGSNGGCGAPCQAGRGYDYVTGLGSPITDQLVANAA